ncbi:MAG TPA: nicotinate-nucleotide--dimethylbenzimidazole phosphoribosyltransferase [Clostridiales bacterium]|mgnify:CR=1 FL=1|nr:nicotinate-nucleotide--dimethylbenzimidazole phosphoribosyltransferase [Clostridiales bacterium]
MSILEQTLTKITTVDREAARKAQQRLDSLTKPPGSLGVLEDIIITLASITGNAIPRVDKKVVIIMAGDHGVTDEGVSPYPKEVTPQMVLNFLSGGAAINVLTRHAGGEIVCCDIGVATDIDHPGLLVRKIRYGTDNIAKGPAMSRQQAVKAIETGITVARDQIAKGAQLLATGEMGIGNTTASSAILGVYSSKDIKDIVGRGTGLDDKGLEKKAMVIERALRVNNPDPSDPIDVLSKVGGLEIAGLTGVILGAAANKAPVVIDGFISSAAALLASKLKPQSVQYMIASHVSEEPGHKIMLDLIGLYPMLHMKMRLGEGTGAALGFHIIDAATKIQAEMATFQSAGVSSSKKE